MSRIPPYEPHVAAGDVVQPSGGGTFVRSGGVKTAIVRAVRVEVCPMEGPEWLAETTAGDYFTHVLETVAPRGAENGESR